MPPDVIAASKTTTEATVFSFHELLANVFYYAIKDVSNHDCTDAIKEIGKDFLATFDTATDEVYFQTQVSEKLVPLKKTIKTENFARTAIFACGDIGTETEAKDIQFNIPELFYEE